MNQSITVIDAFTAQRFSGNPAAVCLLREARDEAWMRNVAREMNLAETAFLRRREDGFDLRWFTPKVEVDLCGHATLAAAHALWESGELDRGEIARFHTRSGLLTATRREGLIELDFPATPAEATVTPLGLAEALHVSPVWVGRTPFDYLVEVEGEGQVRELAPDLTALAEFPVRGIIVTSGSETRTYDFVSRFFAPAAGVPEDPVTGSAHCALAPFWGARLGRSDLAGFQASPRGGLVRVRLSGDRVILGGEAVTVLKGELV